MKTLIVRAIKVDGGYTLEADNGNRPTEGRVVATKRKAYEECEAMYNNDTWQGKKIASGYRIIID
jgi:hypothetical protein